MQQIIEFCISHKLVLMADEVYQENIWSSKKTFHSFRKVALDMDDARKKLELVSFHSTSKGFFGEYILFIYYYYYIRCGRRGGFMEILNFDPKVQEQLYKMASVSLCSNLEGQITVGVMVNPPKKGDASFDLYEKEKSDILQSLKRRADKLNKALNNIPGVECQELEGALYAFPQITIPPSILESAKHKKVAPDFEYCMELLLKTGMVVVPGSGFGEKEGTYHFRCTILPPEDQMDEVVKRFTDFQTGVSGKTVSKAKKD